MGTGKLGRVQGEQHGRRAGKQERLDRRPAPSGPLTILIFGPSNTRPALTGGTSTAWATSSMILSILALIDRALERDVSCP